MIFSPRISAKDLATFCRRVGTSLSAGVDLRKTFAQEALRGSSAQRKNVQTISQLVAEGESVSAALLPTGSYFPLLFREMVEISEQTGQLDVVLLRLAGHYDHQVQLRRIFLGGIIWPAIQLGIALFVVGLLIYVQGAFTGLEGERIDLLGFGLVGSTGLFIYCWIVGGLAVLLFLIVRGFTRGRLWTASLQRVALAVPGLGQALTTLALARMSWSLAMTTATAMDIRRSLKLSLRSSQNAKFIDQTDFVERELSAGHEVHEALRLTNVFPAGFVDTVEVGEQSGRLSESMEHLSANYRDQARAALATISVLASMAIWALVGLFIIVLILRLMMFYVGMINGLIDGI